MLLAFPEFLKLMFDHHNRTSFFVLMEAASLPPSLPALDICIPELDKAHDQQHNRHTSHAEEVAKVHADENRVAVQV
jgi:hypothetical protein